MKEWEVMNMSSRIDKSVGLEKAVKNLFVFESDDEKLNFKAEQLHLAIMIKIKELMDKKGWKKSDLAFALGVKKPFITKLFSAEKFLNIKMIAKIEEIFDVYFDINPVSRLHNRTKKRERHTQIIRGCL